MFYKNLKPFFKALVIQMYLLFSSNCERVKTKMFNSHGHGRVAGRSKDLNGIGKKLRTSENLLWCNIFNVISKYY